MPIASIRNECHEIYPFFDLSKLAHKLDKDLSPRANRDNDLIIIRSIIKYISINPIGDANRSDAEILNMNINSSSP